MEGALVTFACKAGLDPADLRAANPQTDTIPFDAQHRFMATLHHDHAGHAAIHVKGAPERLLEMCTSQHCDDDGARPIDAAWWHARAQEIAAQGQRVIAIATRSVSPEMRGLRFADVEGGLTLLGLVGLIDPPRDEAVAAVAECRAAGIRVKMITGDHAGTARAIGRQLGHLRSLHGDLLRHAPCRAFRGADDPGHRSGAAVRAEGREATRPTVREGPVRLASTDRRPSRCDAVSAAGRGVGRSGRAAAPAAR
ncbi:HAD family hydrolase [Rhodovulum sp. 12E13]|nr:HAD family hydrolase [Rhodovulum sp. 12E13]